MPRPPKVETLPRLPMTIEALIPCPVCAVVVATSVQLGAALTSRFGKGRLGVALKAPRYEHACGQDTLDSALDREADGDRADDVDRPRLLT